MISLSDLGLRQWASRRRRDLLELLDRLTPTISELTQQIERQVEKYPAAQRRMTHPGVGALTALAWVLIIGEPERFECGKQIAAYLGLVQEEGSSGERPRLGHISKQDSGLMRFFLVEAAQARDEAIRSGGPNFSIWFCDEDGRSPWHADWRFVCTGCGATNGIMSS